MTFFFCSRGKKKGRKQGGGKFLTDTGNRNRNMRKQHLFPNVSETRSRNTKEKAIAEHESPHLGIDPLPRKIRCRSARKKAQILKMSTSRRRYVQIPGNSVSVSLRQKVPELRDFSHIPPTVPTHPQPRPITLQLFLDFCAIFSPRMAPQTQLFWGVSRVPGLGQITW